MADNTVVKLQPAPTPQPGPYAGCSYLGPAEVIEADPSGLRLRLANGEETEAIAALAFSYEPAAGDTVVALGNEAGCYVVGVLMCQGKGVLSFPGDLELQAAGKLSLRASQGVEIDSPAMDVRVGKLNLLARAVTERFQSLRQSVTELLSVQAGKSHTVVEGASYTRAQSSTLQTKDKVTINGKAIHLG